MHTPSHPIPPPTPPRPAVRKLWFVGFVVCGGPVYIYMCFGHRSGSEPDLQSKLDLPLKIFTTPLATRGRARMCIPKSIPTRPQRRWQERRRRQERERGRGRRSMRQLPRVRPPSHLHPTLHPPHPPSSPPPSSVLDASSPPSSTSSLALADEREGTVASKKAPAPFSETTTPPPSTWPSEDVQTGVGGGWS